MKNVLGYILLLCVLSNLSLGQQSPTYFNPNILVHSQGLPNELLLFVPDTASQILFNPARANDYSGSFVYGTYAADFKKYDNYSENYELGKNPTIAVATLFNAYNSKWLFLFTNGIAELKSDFNSKGVYNNADSYSTTVFGSENIFRNYEEKEAITTFRLSRIFSTEIGNSSMGIFAIFNTDFAKSFMTRSNSYRRIYGTTPKYFLSSNYAETHKSERDNSQYVLGFEFSLAKENWDYITRVSYQKSTSNDRRISLENNQQHDSTYNPPISYSNKSNRTNNEAYFNTVEPYAVVFENYYQQKSSFISLEGNLFVSAKAYFSKGEGKGSGDYYNAHANYNNGILGSNDTSRGIIDNKFDDKDWGFSFTPGYLLKKSFSDLSLMSGIIMVAGHKKNTFRQSDFSSLSRPEFTNITSKLTFAILTIPVYINYSPAEWISFWGGMNYSYGYSKHNRENLHDIRDVRGISNLISSSTYAGYQSAKSVFLGAELKHLSGLRLQISFDEDVASFRDWNMSLGYHF